MIDFFCFESFMNHSATPRLLAGPVILIAMTLAAALSRLIPHPPNFSPVEAMALFGGAYLARRWMGVALPLIAMLLSDIALGLLSDKERFRIRSPPVLPGGCSAGLRGRDGSCVGDT